ncbi:MAG: alpha/beta hydrolase [Spirochaetales bacterium]|nr:alpha/beta hydrolase [Spirochaetales bacterium]
MKCNNKRIVVVLVVLMFIASSLTALEVALRDTEKHEIYSEIVRKDYTITVALPKNYERSTRRYPVVYVLDGDANFALTTETARPLMEVEGLSEMIIVGIGYGVSPGEAVWLARRERDFTPVRMVYREAGETGGAFKFIAFIKDELIPFVESNYRAMPEDRTIMGHSLGGLFVLYSLFRAPDVFNKYAAMSSSLWWAAASAWEPWQNWTIFKYEEEYAQNNTDLSAKLFMSIGTLEILDGEQMDVSYYEKLYTKLEDRGYASLETELLIMDNETHYSSLPGAISRALRVLFP